MKNTQCFLLSVLILSCCGVQSLAYYHPDEGRWLSRDPIVETSFALRHAALLEQFLADRQRSNAGQLDQRSDHTSAIELVNASAPNLQVAFRNSPLVYADHLGLACVAYVMIGHFGRQDPTNPTNIIPSGVIWDQLGTSTFQLDHDDAILSMSCHMVSFLRAARQRFPGTETPAGWPPSPYNNDDVLYLSDFVSLLNQGQLRAAVADVVNKLFGQPHCCRTVEAKARCDSAAASGLATARSTGTLRTTDPCANGGFSRQYSQPTASP